jgi:hypothetical protein
VFHVSLVPPPCRSRRTCRGSTWKRHRPRYCARVAKSADAPGAPAVRPGPIRRDRDEWTRRAFWVCANVSCAMIGRVLWALQRTVRLVGAPQRQNQRRRGIARWHRPGPIGPRWRGIVHAEGIQSEQPVGIVLSGRKKAPLSQGKVIETQERADAKLTALRCRTVPQTR